MTEKIYPMPSFPTLIVKNVEASSNFYQNALGFKSIFTMTGPDGQPSLVHLRWTKYADLLITRSRDGKELPETKGVGISLNFNMSSTSTAIWILLQSMLVRTAQT